MLKFTAPIAAIAVVLVSSPAFAKAATAPSIRVEYKDLDLSNEKGRKTLDRRITAAAKKLCPGQATGTRIPQNQECFDTAMKSVRDQLAAKGVGLTTASR